jgi:hypothetical protein
MEAEKKAEEISILIFDDSMRSDIIKATGYRAEKQILLDSEGKIVVSQQDFEKITPQEFGGVLRGSKIVIKKDESELLNYFLSQVK